MPQKVIKSIKSYIKNDKALAEFDYADSKDVYLASVKEFDEQSNIIKEIGYRPDGLIDNHYTNTFNNTGQLIEHAVYDDGDELLQTHKYDYNSEGEMIGIASFFAEMGDSDYTHVLYNDEGLIIEKRNMDSDDDLYSTIKFEYKDDKLVKECHYNDDNKLESEKQFVYNDKGVLMEESEIDHLDNDKRVFKYEYDSAGSRTKMLMYNMKDQLIMRISYEFNEDGKNVKQVEEDQKGISTTLFGYTNDGQYDFQEKYDADGALVARWEYKYQDGLLVETGTYFREEKTPEKNDEDENEEDSPEFELVKRISTDFIYEFYN